MAHAVCKFIICPGILEERPLRPAERGVPRGSIALAQKDYDSAIAELQQANDQNPRDLYRLCQAYQGKGDSAKAQEACTRSAKFNSLPQLNYAFVRAKAQKVVGKKG